MSRSSSLLGGLCSDEVSNLEDHKSCNYYKKNQSLFLEGSFPRGVFCINQGKIKVFKRGDEGKEQIIHIAKEGEMVGFRAMFSGDPYNVAAETLERRWIGIELSKKYTQVGLERVKPFNEKKRQMKFEFEKGAE
jgi:CRP/FNR family transcriptional regulator